VATSTPFGVQVDRVLDQALASQRIVGAVVLIAFDGEVVYQRAAGWADREAGVPIRLDTLFRFSSLVKPLASAAVLALVARGELMLDEPVTQWLPEFRPRLPRGEAPLITVRHLLTHTAGLTYRFTEPEDGPYRRAGISEGLDSSTLSLAEHVQRIASVPLVSAPGREWRYSVAIDVLGLVLEGATHSPLPQAMADLVTRPLGLVDTGFEVATPERLAVPYIDAGPQPRRMTDPDVPLPWRPDISAGPPISPSRIFSQRAFPSAGGGMAGSASDMLRFLEAIRQGGGPVLPRDLAGAMQQNEVGDASTELLGPGAGFGFGGAVLLDPIAAGSPQSAGTWYWSGVYGHRWYVDPTRKLTVVALTNTAPKVTRGSSRSISGMRSTAGRRPSPTREALLLQWEENTPIVNLPAVSLSMIWFKRPEAPVSTGASGRGAWSGVDRARVRPHRRDRPGGESGLPPALRVELHALLLQHRWCSGHA
jgi:CubicO group peptidase (beta-lactamase class C family)